MPVFLLEKSHGQKSLVGYSPKGYKESDTTDRLYHALFWVPQVVLGLKNPPAKAGDKRETSLITGSGRSPRGRNGTPLHYSCLENSMGRGATENKGEMGKK